MGGHGKRREGAPTTPEGVIADQAERQQALTGALYALPFPTLAALAGPAAGATVAYRLMKANLDRALRTALPTCLGAEAEGTVTSAATEDHREAVAAFVEKRSPAFEGR